MPITQKRLNDLSTVDPVNMKFVPVLFPLISSVSANRADTIMAYEVIGEIHETLFLDDEVTKEVFVEVKQSNLRGLQNHQPGATNTHLEMLKSVVVADA